MAPVFLSGLRAIADRQHLCGIANRITGSGGRRTPAEKSPSLPFVRGHMAHPGGRMQLSSAGRRRLPSPERPQ